MWEYKRTLRSIKFNCINYGNCYICNKFSNIVEQHHLLLISSADKPIFEVIKNDSQYGYLNKLHQIMQTVYLCPNHHRIFHKLLSKEDFTTSTYLEEKELKLYIKLLNISFKSYKILYEYLIRIKASQDICLKINKDKLKIESSLLLLQKLLYKNS